MGDLVHCAATYTHEASVLPTRATNDIVDVEACTFKHLFY